ncbi:MAG: hypothetical protein Kapaf2KO_15890 [Candidatus Kapaibacteriales bacterium]
MNFGEVRWFINPEQFTNTLYTFEIVPQDGLSNMDLTSISPQFIIYDAPRIISQAQSGVYCKDEVIVLANTSNGSDVTFQWYKDGVTIPGATEMGYVINNADYDDSGVYTFDVIGRPECPIATSESIVIHVARETEITAQPMPSGAFVGGAAEFTFDAHVNGVPPTYQAEIQWFKDSIPLMNNERISGAMSNLLNIQNIIADDFVYNYGYWAMIIGRCDTAYTDTVGIVPANIIVSRLDSIGSTCAGENVIFAIDAASNTGEAVTYQWQKDGNDIIDDGRIVGAMTDRLLINNTMDSDDGQYSVSLITSNGNVTANTNSFTFDVKQAPMIVTDLNMNETIKEGEAITMTFDVSGDEPIEYTWMKDGQEIQKSAMNTFEITAAVKADAGTYMVVAENECGRVTSANATLTVNSSVISSVENTIHGIKLHNAMPSPATEEFAVRYDLEKASDVNFELRDSKGSLITMKKLGIVPSGSYQVDFDSVDMQLSNGVYYITLITDNATLTVPVQIVR